MNKHERPESYARRLIAAPADSIAVNESEPACYAEFEVTDAAELERQLDVPCS